MVRFETVTLDSQQLDIAANLGKLKTIEIESDKWIQQIIMKLKGTFTTTDAGFAPQQDNPMGLLKEIQLVGEGGKTGTLDIHYGVDGEHGFSRLYHEDTLEKAVIPHRITLGSGALTAAAFAAVGVMDFRLDPRSEDEAILMLPPQAIQANQLKNPYTSALLPAWAFSKLNLNVRIGTHADLRTDAGTNNSFPTATLDVSIRYAVLEPGDPDIPLENSIELVTTEQQPTNLAVKSNFAVYPTLGNLARRYMVTCYDTANKVRIDDVISKYRVKQTSPVNWTSDDMNMEESQIQDAREFGIGSQESGKPFRAGITVIDFDNNRNLDKARNLAGLQSKDSFKLLFDIATAANRKIIITEKMAR